ncbi:MAG: aldehyde dehydrogenase [Verrucomicrobiaceae bacterium]|nr:aldehyde dehydrogenase [Verrucomicrobiaceae bacterium]
MNKEIHIPILRLGQEYRSLDTVELESSEGRTVLTHTANPGLIRRDLLGIEKSREALQAVPAETLADYCEQAAELFLHEELPVGEATQTPQDYIESLSALTKLPHTLVRMNMGKVYAAMSQIRTVIGGLTRGLPLELFDRGLSAVDDLEVNFFPVTGALGVSLPSNAPAVNSLWLPAPVLKIPVLLKPGREDPFTPLRIVQALIAAGFPREAFGFYPTSHEGGDTILMTCGRGIAFGSDATVRKYSGFPSIQVHGTGRSKVLMGSDYAGKWTEHTTTLVESISANGGRSCINTSAILVPTGREELADALAKELAAIEPLPRDHEEALLCGFSNTKWAQSINDLIDEHLRVEGAEDVTARYRNGPRLVEMHGQTYLRPTLISCADSAHPLANTEFMFPFASICEMPQERMLGEIGETLVVSAWTEDPAWIRELMNSPDIERLNIGPFPTNRVQWEQPHEGNLFEFLYRRRAIQGNLAAVT